VTSKKFGAVAYNQQKSVSSKGIKKQLINNRRKKSHFMNIVQLY
jgi:hypothetical protein